MQRNIEEVKEILNKHLDELIGQFKINLIYIFGSFAKGNNREDSDLDIAVLLEGETNPFIKLELLNELIDIFHRDDIDLVILNSVDEVLKFQVIKYGKVIYMEDLTTKVMFEARVMSEYMDMEHFRNIQQEYTHKRFLEVIKNDKKNLNCTDDFSEE